MSVFNNFYRKALKPFKIKRFYRQFIRNGDLVFDIGANVGVRSAAFLALGAKVVAVEPQSSCIEIIKRKFSSNKNFVCVQKAVSNTTGSAEMFISNVSEASTLSLEFVNTYNHQQSIHWNNRERVQLITLSQLIHEFGVPGYIKIDIEGYELKALETLDAPVKFLSFEYNQPLSKNAIACLDLLNDKNEYRFNFMPYDDMRMLFPDWLAFLEFKKKINDLDPGILTGEIFVSLTE